MKLYEENTDESKKELLKKNLQYAYEAIPKARRRYVLGDMDIHDSPIRDILYGEHNMVSWDYRRYVADNGELYLPHFNESHQKIEYVRKSGYINNSNPPEDIAMFAETVDLVRRSGVVSFPKIMRHFLVGYAKARRLIDELGKAAVISTVTNDTEPGKVLIEHGNNMSAWDFPKTK
ncbi:MAG: DNA translocase FtsK [Candidatus Shapirobacteria bacterium]|nr:DNA translocase FtsK [Candidatus Shapirobacteria bacterium]